MLADSISDDRACVMLPRTTLEGFVINREGFQPASNPTRITFIETQYTPKINPWIALHDGTVHDAASLARWELTIPQYGCACRKFYAEWKAANEPDFTSPEAFFAWGVRLHNAVNEKLGKPQITLNEALTIWRKTDGMDDQKDKQERS
jgi:hypothetical protein